MTFNPDLVFNDGLATGDVKYKITSTEWRRSDLYQAIAFATIYRTNHAAIIGFRQPGTPPLHDLTIGDMKIRQIDWLADPDRRPEEAAAELASAVAEWIGVVHQPRLAMVP